jgi:CheY-like chemotaxis protein
LRADEKTSAIAVIAFTADPSGLANVRQLAECCLHKPIEVPTFLAAVRSLLEADSSQPT